MDDRFNTIAGWVLFAGIIALGASTLSYKYFKGERPETLGYVIGICLNKPTYKSVTEKAVPLSIDSANFSLK